jgi:hypothetical protein
MHVRWTRDGQGRPTLPGTVCDSGTRERAQPFWLCPFRDRGNPRQMARVTFPALRQRVQTRIRLTVPFTITRTCWMFGRNRRFVRMCEWLILLPVCGSRPQISHRRAKVRTSSGFGLAAGHRRPQRAMTSIV